MRKGEKERWEGEGPNLPATRIGAATPMLAIVSAPPTTVSTPPSMLTPVVPVVPHWSSRITC